jgi:hypothetical protein
LWIAERQFLIRDCRFADPGCGLRIDCRLDGFKDRC